jgi:hypothetical protein
MTDQRCGTCRWWDYLGVYSDGTPFGECSFPMPAAVDGLFDMVPTGGTTCPCWQKKEQDDNDR